MNWITLATEDSLSEALGIRLIQELEGRLHLGQSIRRNGSGYLRSRLASFCEMSYQQPVLLITDLDRKVCASTLIGEWFGARVKPLPLLFRVAVREVESWLLADHEAMRTLFVRPALKLPTNPDDLEDPKQFLIKLAKKGPRTVREAIVPEAGSIAAKGLGYNNLLVGAVKRHWDPVRAQQRSESLRRARFRLSQLAAQMQ